MSVLLLKVQHAGSTMDKKVVELLHIQQLGQYHGWKQSFQWRQDIYSPTVKKHTNYSSCERIILKEKNPKNNPVF